MNPMEACMCPVCLGTIKNPVILQCSHNLCYDCASKIVELNKISSDSLVLLCPYCRSKTILSYPSIDALPRNKLLETILSEFQLSQVSIKSLKCQLCVDSPEDPSLECITCELYSCAACAAAHLAKPRFAHHKILPLSKSKRIVCIDHFQELSWFCTVDKVMLCKLCLDKHQDHPVVLRSQMNESFNGEINGIRKTLKSLGSGIESEVKRLESKWKVVEKAEQESLEKLDGIYNLLKKEIKEFKENSAQKLAEVYSGLKLKLTQQISELVDVKENVDRIDKLADPAELIQSSQIYLGMKPSRQDLALPDLNFTSFNLPLLELSRSKHLYYLNRGTREFYCYDIKNKDLLVNELPPDCPYISRWCSFTTAPDGRILVTGGKIERNAGSHRTCMYIDPNKLTFSVANPMLRGHSSHISLRVFSKIYVISGKNEENVCDSFCEVLDTMTESWTQIAKINYPRTCAAGCFLNNNIYVLGGFQNLVCNSIEKYNVEINIWSVLTVVLPDKIWQHGCFALDNKRMLVFGGEKDSEEPSKVSNIFNVGSETFSGTSSFEEIPVYLFFWVQIIRVGDYLYTINKEKTLVKYSILENRWGISELG